MQSVDVRRWMTATAALGLALGLLVGCSSGKICEKAAKKYSGCVEEVLGKGAAKMVRAKEKEGIAACKKDEATQKMYKKCLPVKGCKKFMDCIMDYAKKHGP